MTFAKLNLLESSRCAFGRTRRPLAPACVDSTVPTRHIENSFFLTIPSMFASCTIVPNKQWCGCSGRCRGCCRRQHRYVRLSKEIRRHVKVDYRVVRLLESPSNRMIEKGIQIPPTAGNLIVSSLHSVNLLLIYQIWTYVVGRNIAMATLKRWASRSKNVSVMI